MFLYAYTNNMEFIPLYVLSKHDSTNHPICTKVKNAHGYQDGSSELDDDVESSEISDFGEVEDESEPNNVRIG